MWTYIKMLEYPVNIKTTNAKLAMAIMSQLGGPDGEKGASTRYLSQRYAMPDKRVIGVLTDIGREASEMFHSKIPTFGGAACRETSTGYFFIESFATV